MPYVEEKHLVRLHESLEKKEQSEERLLRVLKKERSAYALSKKKHLVVSGVLLFLLACSITWGVITYVSEPSEQVRASETIGIEEVEELRQTIAGLRSENEALKRSLVLADSLLDPERLLYTVQVGAFEERKLPLLSRAFDGMKVTSDQSINRYALGNFATLEEARELRKELITMGFEDAFIASYRNGKRIKIEEAF
ncbi:SPOR domain-containing protein [Robertkochia aurantiaca]|uniref:SPOR domain-containing protein n=1 Tax=Robertkochia aurantiaca TaxID=2873700 RepID=UPI001CCD618B|nr:SPOR domain-containing protein [Robertkochia sp. 3YJGBD-33]